METGRGEAANYPCPGAKCPSLPGSHAREPGESSSGGGVLPTWKAVK